MGMEVHTDFEICFREKKQLEKMIEYLIDEDRGRPLIAAYLMNVKEPGEALTKAYIEKLDTPECFDGSFDWKKYDSWLDADEIDVKDTSMSGSVMCFNEFDPTYLFPKLFKEVAEAYPEAPFEGKIYTACDESVEEVVFNYADFHLKLTNSFAPFENYGDDVDSLKYQMQEQEIIIKAGKADVFEFPKGIKVIEENMIPNRKLLTSIVVPEGVEEIGLRAFSKCKELASIELPTTLKAIDAYAFEDCRKLTSIKFANGLERIDRGAFKGCKSLKNVNLPETLMTIKGYAFAGCESIIEMIIPEGVTELTATFTGCKGLVSISLPSSLRYINEEKSGIRSFFRSGDIFSGCKNLKSVKLPEGVEVIGRNAFKDCINLTNIEVPKSLKLIMKDAFKNCPNLEHIEGLSCNTNLPYGVFDDCPKVNYTIPSGEIKSLGWWNVPEDRNAENITITNGIVEIGHYGFEGWTNLTSVVIPDGVTRICERAFSDCSNLMNVVIPDSVTKIDEYAFSDCISLQHIALPKKLKQIDPNVFEGCKGLTSIQMSGSTWINGYLGGNVKVKRTSGYECDKIDHINFDGNIFVLTGFDFEEAEKITGIIQQRGGEVKSSTVLKTNYLVVAEVSDYMSAKISRAVELKERGKPILIISAKQFYACMKK